MALKRLFLIVEYDKNQELLYKELLKVLIKNKLEENDFREMIY